MAAPQQTLDFAQERLAGGHVLVLVVGSSDACDVATCIHTLLTKADHPRYVNALWVCRSDNTTKDQAMRDLQSCWQSRYPDTPYQSVVANITVHALRTRRVAYHGVMHDIKLALTAHYTYQNSVVVLHAHMIVHHHWDAMLQQQLAKLASVGSSILTMAPRTVRDIIPTMPTFTALTSVPDEVAEQHGVASAHMPFCSAASVPWSSVSIQESPVTSLIATTMLLAGSGYCMYQLFQQCDHTIVGYWTLVDLYLTALLLHNNIAIYSPAQALAYACTDKSHSDVYHSTLAARGAYPCALDCDACRITTTNPLDNFLKYTTLGKQMYTTLQQHGMSGVMKHDNCTTRCIKKHARRDD